MIGGHTGDAKDRTRDAKRSLYKLEPFRDGSNGLRVDKKEDNNKQGYISTSTLKIPVTMYASPASTDAMPVAQKMNPNF